MKKAIAIIIVVVTTVCCCSCGGLFSDLFRVATSEMKASDYIPFGIMDGYIFEEAQPWMTYEDICELAGGAGRPEYNRYGDELTYSWKGAESYSKAYMDFSNDMLVLKWQYNIEKHFRTVEATKENFDRLEFGMTYSQAEEIMGGPGYLSFEYVAFSGLEPYYWSKSYQWDGESGSVELRFFNGELEIKRDYGIEMPGQKPCDMTSEQFSEIEIGMKYRDVCRLAGSNGEFMTREEYEDKMTVAYSWSDSETGAFYYLEFEDDVLTAVYQGGGDFYVNGMTLSQFEYISLGMSYDEICEFTKNTGELSAMYGYFEYNLDDDSEEENNNIYSTYRWSVSGSDTGMVELTFWNGELTQKTHTSENRTGKATIYKSTYKSISSGMDYNFVSGFAGADGDLVEKTLRENGVLFEVYMWRDVEESVDVTMYFEDGLLKLKTYDFV